MCWQCVTLIFPPDTRFPLPSESDLSVTRYAHTPHYRRLPDGSWLARFARDELEWALAVAEVIGARQTEEK